MIEDLLKISLKSIKNKGIRSWLTVIGIVIGIAAIVSLISLGEGLQNAIDQQFAILGSNLILVMASGMGGGSSKLTDHDIDLIKSVKGVDLAAGLSAKSAKIKYRDQVYYAYVSGLAPGDAQDILLEGTGIKIEKGQKKFKAGESGKAAIGYEYYGTDNIFDTPLKIGDKITINDRRFTVASFISRIGNPSDDTNIYIIEDDYRSLFSVKDDYMEIMVRVRDDYEPKDVAEKIKEKIRRDRSEKKGEESVTVITMDQIMSAVGTILDAVQAIVVGIALISLVVGGVNIMNTMYTSVLERTREIGVMKAIGARNSTITTMFIIESGIIGLIGGSLGCLLGAAMSKGVEYVALTQLDSTMIQASITPQLIIGALSFSFIVGVLSGFLPAKQASELNPVEALRYE
ncbi:MAG: ABC transporter permease [Candidatus Altiarchaeia archaeon]